ncbi:hypothetical protein J6X73_02235 [Candidatus Saccharibacteria bacterium]|nr:hypothetical protein [Candidatus Saccharibacteria bacterium]
MKMDINTKRWLVVAVALVIILLVISVIPNIRFGANDELRMRIGNWGEMEIQVPEGTRKMIEEALYGQAGMNMGGKNVPSSGAKIRIGTQRFVKTDVGIMVGDFIVDVPDIEQSYIMQYFYGDGSINLQMAFNDGQELEVGASVVSYCVTNRDDIIYPDFKCQDKYGAYDSNKLINAFYFRFLLPHILTLNNNEEATINMGYDKYGKFQLNVAVASCKNDEKILREAENATREWVAESGFSPNIFGYDVFIEYNYCVLK